MAQDHMATVVELLREQSPEAEITRETRFVEDLAVDSIDLIELVMDIEEKYDIGIGDEDALEMTTVGQLVDYLEAKVPA